MMLANPPSPYKPISGVKIIGLGHKARQGKDTTADWLVANRGALKIAFSDALYDVARVMFGMKEKDAPLLQVLGTEVFRKKDPNVWINNVYYKLLDKKPSLAVITDVRFPNEAEMVKQLGGTLIKLVRLTPEGQFIDPNRDANHPSEIALDDYKGWDRIIEATSCEELTYQLRNIP